MIQKKFLDYWNIIEDKSIGRYMGSLVVNLATDNISHSICEKRVRILQSADNLEWYKTIISKDIYSLKNNKLVENKKQEHETFYYGRNLSKAIDSFKEIIEKKTKENVVHKIFSRN